MDLDWLKAAPLGPLLVAGCLLWRHWRADAAARTARLQAAALADASHGESLAAQLREQNDRLERVSNGVAFGVALTSARAGELVEVSVHGLAQVAVSSAAAADAMGSMRQALGDIADAFHATRKPAARKPAAPEPTLRPKGRALDLED
jgi:hypothetical protein